jgi:uncharacterized protein YqgV (UPF0045/DUF77 family)
MHRALLLLIGASNAAAASVTGVRFSLYPKVPDGASLREAIKSSTKGLRTLGLAASADSVSSCLLGDESAVFEAARVVFGRAARLPSEPHVSMVCTFSYGDPALGVLGGTAFEPPPRSASAQLDAPSADGYDGVADIALPPAGGTALPPAKRAVLLRLAQVLRQVPARAASALARASGPARAEQIARGIAQASDPARIAARIASATEKASAVSAAPPPAAPPKVRRRPDEAGWVAEAIQLPGRVACQFSVYVLGDPNYEAMRARVSQLVASSSAACPGAPPPFCEMVEGDGEEVFTVLRDVFTLARESSGGSGGDSGAAAVAGSHVVLQAALTANLAKWKREALAARREGE